MRKLLLVTALLAGGALIFGSPVSAAVGCACATLTNTPVCVASVDVCLSQVKGVCIAPCDYKPPKKAMKKVKKKAMKKKM